MFVSIDLTSSHDHLLELYCINNPSINLHIFGIPQAKKTPRRSPHLSPRLLCSDGVSVAARSRLGAGAGARTLGQDLGGTRGSPAGAVGVEGDGSARVWSKCVKQSKTIWMMLNQKKQVAEFLL